MRVCTEEQTAIEQAEFERSLRQDLPKNLMDDEAEGQGRSHMGPISLGMLGQIQRRERRFPEGVQNMSLHRCSP